MQFPVPEGQFKGNTGGLKCALSTVYPERAQIP